MNFVTYHLESSEQLFDELHDICSLDPTTSSLQELDYAAKQYLDFSAHFYSQYLCQDEHAEDFARCLCLFLDSALLQHHSDRIVNLLIDEFREAGDTRDAETSAKMLICLSMLAIRSNEHQHTLKLLRSTNLSGKTGRSALQAMLSQVYSFEPIELRSEQHDSARQKLELLCIRMLYDVCRVSRLEMDELGMGFAIWRNAVI